MYKKKIFLIGYQKEVGNYLFQGIFALSLFLNFSLLGNQVIHILQKNTCYMVTLEPVNFPHEIQITQKNINDRKI